MPPEPRQADDQHRQHEQRHRDVQPVALPGEGEDAQDDAGHRRGHQQQDAELDDVTPLEAGGAAEDGAEVLQVGRLAVECAVVGAVGRLRGGRQLDRRLVETDDLAAFLNEEEDGPQQHHRRRRQHADAQQGADDHFDLVFRPAVPRLAHVTVSR